MSFQGELAPSGRLGLTVLHGDGRRENYDETGALLDGWQPDWPGSGAPLRRLARAALPDERLSQKVNEWRLRNFRNVADGLWRLGVMRAATRATKFPFISGSLWGVVIRGDGEVENLGLLGLKVVTTAGVGYIVDAFQNLVEPENQKFHGYGTGTTAEASGDTGLVTELTTQYAVDSTRPTGTTTEGASANIYRTVATLTPDSGGTIAVTEHGVFSASSAGVLLDRTKFTAVNLDSTAGDSLQTTYEITFTAGS